MTRWDAGPGVKLQVSSGSAPLDTARKKSGPMHGFGPIPGNERRSELGIVQTPYPTLGVREPCVEVSAVVLRSSADDSGSSHR